MMYWAIHKDKPLKSKEKIISGLVALTIIVTSILGIINLIIQKAKK